ncbi:MAG: hypothetical protein K0Q62_1998 [Phenylobacterium sp.]|nr:hypothetical protein [Phenylobacterium sp.]
MAMASVLAAASTNAPVSGAISPAPIVADRPSEVRSTEISVLTYNVRGLPWPIAKGRAKALKKIGAELAAMRREGRQPDVVLIQEGFRGEVADLVKASGYRHWAQGPTRQERASGTAPEDTDSAPASTAWRTKGRCWSVWTCQNCRARSM